MILRRLSKGIKEQDWFVVMIVVVGIFVGLQVNDWNEDRKASERSVQNIVQLQKDIKQAITNVEGFYEVRVQRLAEANFALEVLINKTYDPKDETRLFNAINYGAKMAPPQINVGLLGLILSNQEVEVVTEPEVLRAVLEAQGNLILQLNIVNESVARLNNSVSTLEAYFGFKDNLNDAYTIPMDVDVMMNSPEFIYALISVVGLQEAFKPSLETILGELNKLLSVL